jgi:hypothetical protein
MITINLLTLVYAAVCRTLHVPIRDATVSRKILFVKELLMLRWSEIFLAGCTSAAPDSASFRQNKYNHLSHMKMEIRSI